MSTAGSIPGISPTDWQFRSSSGVSLGADIFGVAAMTFFLEKDSRPGAVRAFPWSGIGVGLSTTPVGLDISFADFPSFGLRLRQGIFGSNPMPEDDFQGPCTVFSLGANLGVGFAGTICMFGAIGPVCLHVPFEFKPEHLDPPVTLFEPHVHGRLDAPVRGSHEEVEHR